MSPPFAPTDDQRRQVRALAGFGTKQDDIAVVIGCAPKTLRLHFRRELDVAAIEANSRMAQSLFSQGINGNVTAAIFWMKTQAGWREKHDIEVTGAAGGPVVFRWSDAALPAPAVESTDPDA